VQWTRRPETSGVGVDDVNPHSPTISKSIDHSAKRLGGATRTANHTPQVFWVNADLEEFTPRGVHERDTDLVRVINDLPDKVLQCTIKHYYSAGFV
jgi:hypothetical protein